MSIASPLTPLAYSLSYAALSLLLSGSATQLRSYAATLCLSYAATLFLLALLRTYATHLTYEDDDAFADAKACRDSRDSTPEQRPSAEQEQEGEKL